MIRKSIVSLLILILLQPISAKKIIIKMATLAPEGTEWHGLLVDLGQRWQKETNGEVRLRIYPGGVVGDETDMVRKMRIGQIHGAAMSTEGMSEINPYFTSFYMPMLYQSYDEVDYVREKLNEELITKTEENGFKLLTMVDVGWVYWFSTEPVLIPSDLKKLKIFIWAGDYKSTQLYETHGYQPIPLAMTDVLSGLQTGLISAIGFNPMYTLAQSEINPYFTSFYMPMLYQSYDEVDYVREKLNEELITKTEENGFKLLTMVDVGWVYWFSTEPVLIPSDLKKLKIFIWAGDYKSTQLYETHGYQPIPLAMTDVLSGLQTGLISAIGFNPMYTLAQQLFGIADNMLDMKWGNLTAAIIVDMKTWNRIDPKYQEVMLSVAQDIGKGFQEKNRYESDKAIGVMEEYGLKINRPNPSQFNEWETLIEKMTPDFRGTVIEEKAFDRLMDIMKEMKSH